MTNRERRRYRAERAVLRAVAEWYCNPPSPPRTDKLIRSAAELQEAIKKTTGKQWRYSSGYWYYEDERVGHAAVTPYRGEPGKWTTNVGNPPIFKSVKAGKAFVEKFFRKRKRRSR